MTTKNPLLAAVMDKDFAVFESLVKTSLYNKAARLVESFQPVAVSRVLLEAGTPLGCSDGTEYTFADGTTRTIKRNELRHQFESVPDKLQKVTAEAISESAEMYDTFIEYAEELLAELERVVAEMENAHTSEPNSRLPSHVADFLHHGLDNDEDGEESLSDKAHRFFNRPATDEEMGHIHRYMGEAFSLNPFKAKTGKPYRDDLVKKMSPAAVDFTFKHLTPNHPFLTHLYDSVTYPNVPDNDTHAHEILMDRIKSGVKVLQSDGDTDSITSQDHGLLAKYAFSMINHHGDYAPFGGKMESFDNPNQLKKMIFEQHRSSTLKLPTLARFL